MTNFSKLTKDNNFSCKLCCHHKDEIVLLVSKVRSQPMNSYIKVLGKKVQMAQFQVQKPPKKGGGFEIDFIFLISHKLGTRKSENMLLQLENGAIF